VVSALKELFKSITPYIKASAVMGVTGVKWIIVQSLIKLTGRDIKLFDNRKQALEWLVWFVSAIQIQHMFILLWGAPRVQLAP
jgi:hypothetical protein